MLSSTALENQRAGKVARSVQLHTLGAAWPEVRHCRGLFLHEVNPDKLVIGAGSEVLPQAGVPSANELEEGKPAPVPYAASVAFIKLPRISRGRAPNLRLVGHLRGAFLSFGRFKLEAYLVGEQYNLWEPNEGCWPHHWFIDRSPRLAHLDIESPLHTGLHEFTIEPELKGLVQQIEPAYLAILANHLTLDIPPGFEQWYYLTWDHISVIAEPRPT